METKQHDLPLTELIDTNTRIETTFNNKLNINLPEKEMPPKESSLESPYVGLEKKGGWYYHDEASQIPSFAKNPEDAEENSDSQEDLSMYRNYIYPCCHITEDGVTSFECEHCSEWWHSICLQNHYKYTAASVKRLHNPDVKFSCPRCSGSKTEHPRMKAKYLYFGIAPKRKSRNSIWVAQRRIRFQEGTRLRQNGEYDSIEDAARASDYLWMSFNGRPGLLNFPNAAYQKRYDPSVFPSIYADSKGKKEAKKKPKKTNKRERKHKRKKTSQPNPIQAFPSLPPPLIAIERTLPQRRRKRQKLIRMVQVGPI